MWCTWHRASPVTGPIEVDQRQPGWSSARPTPIEPICASCESMNGKRRTSSRSSKLLVRIEGIVVSINGAPFAPALTGQSRLVSKGMAEETQLEPASAEASPSPRLTVVDRVRLRLTALTTRAAPYAITIDGILLVIVGLYALVGAANSFQGEGFLLIV